MATRGERPRTFLRRVLFAGLALCLLALAWSGLKGGVDQWGQSRTPGQVAQTITQFAFALFALLTLVTMIRGRRWNLMMGAALTVFLNFNGRSSKEIAAKEPGKSEVD